MKVSVDWGWVRGRNRVIKRAGRIARRYIVGF